MTVVNGIKIINFCTVYSCNKDQDPKYFHLETVPLPGGGFSGEQSRVSLLTVTFPPDLIVSDTVSGPWLPSASDNFFDFEFFAPAASSCVR